MNRDRVRGQSRRMDGYRLESDQYIGQYYQPILVYHRRICSLIFFADYYAEKDA